jgi:hypothetical protein
MVIVVALLTDIIPAEHFFLFFLNPSLAVEEMVHIPKQDVLVSASTGYYWFMHVPV